MVPKERGEMNVNLFNYPPHRDEYDFAQKLGGEFDPLYIRSLAAEERVGRSRNRRKHWLMALGSWLVSLGLRIKHGANPYAVTRHVSPRLVSIHNHRYHRRK